MGEHVKPTKILERFGLTATIIYVLALVIGIPLLGKFGYIKLDAITLNELGDFLAGAFGPLAIFWLVLGFFQQGQELRNSVATLELQARELANSVEQQRELVNVSREQLEEARVQISRQEQQRKSRILPDFRLRFANIRGDSLSSASSLLEIKNLGNKIYDFEMTFNLPSGKLWQVDVPNFDHEQIKYFNIFNDDPVCAISSSFDFNFIYQDEDRDKWEVSGVITPPNDGSGFGNFTVTLNKSSMVFPR